jgi:preprotein translocase subunit SecD
VLLAVPSSPAHRSLKQGLDLQGGLEYVLKAQPPKGHQLTAADLDRSVSIMRNRVDKLGVSEPIITKQGKDQISIQLAGVHNVAQAAKIIGSTAQLELYDLEPALVPPSTSTAGPVATRSLYQLLSRVQAVSKAGTPAQYVLFKPVKVPTTTGTGKKKQTTTTTVYVRAAGPTATLRRDTNGNAGILDASGRGDGERSPARREDRLLPVQARPVSERPVRPVPEHEGNRVEALGHEGRHRPEREPGRADAVHRQGQQGLPSGDEKRGGARPDSAARPALRDRAR